MLLCASLLFCPRYSTFSRKGYQSVQVVQQFYSGYRYAARLYSKALIDFCMSAVYFDFNCDRLSLISGADYATWVTRVLVIA